MKKSIYKIILFLVSVFLLMGCGSKEFLFKEYDILLKSDIKEKHRFKKEKYVVFKQSHIVVEMDYDDIFKNKYYSKVSFSDKKYKSYNFECHLSSGSIHGYTLGGNDPIYFLDKKIKMTKLYDSDNVLGHVFYQYERKIKDGFLSFTCYTKDSIDINFLYQKFNEIEIIEK